MVLSKRERLIVYLMVAVVGALALDRIFISPLWGQKTELDQKVVAARQQLSNGQRLISTARRLVGSWDDHLKTTLKRDPSEAESQALNNLRDWAQDARLSVSSLKPERTEKDKDFLRITVRASANGSMSEVSRFLYRIQTAGIPVRITDLQINSRKEATDDLMLTLGVSTLLLPPESDRRARSAAPVPPRENQP